MELHQLYNWYIREKSQVKSREHESGGRLNRAKKN